MMLATRYVRLALAAAFLSAVASRFGLWPKGSWDSFERYNAQVNSFLPAVLHPVLARVATVFELSFGVLLLVGWRLRVVAAGASVLLAIFGVAMAISFGLKEPLDYSVFSASAAAALLSATQATTNSTRR